MPDPTVDGAARTVKTAPHWRDAICEVCGLPFRTNKTYSQTCSRKCATERRVALAAEVRRELVPLTIRGTTAVVPLTKGFHALIDASDWHRVATLKWFACLTSGRIYAKTSALGDRPAMLMHRLLADAGPAQFVDHKKGPGLDNRQSNIRVCTKAQNQMNLKKRVDSRNRFKGIRRAKRGRWQAVVRCNGVSHCMGTFGTDIEAARAYDKAAIRLFGEFANPNFPAGVTHGPLAAETHP